MKGLCPREDAISKMLDSLASSFKVILVMRNTLLLMLAEQRIQVMIQKYLFALIALFSAITPINSNGDTLDFPLEEWLSFCEMKKRSYSSQSTLFMGFSSGVDVKAIIFNSAKSLNLDGVSIPLIHYVSEPKVEFSNPNGDFELKLEGHRGEVMLISRRRVLSHPQTLYDVLSHSSSGLDKLPPDFIDEIKRIDSSAHTVIYDSLTFSPEDIRCDTDSVANDIKVMYSLLVKPSYQLSNGVSYIDLFDKGLKGGWATVKFGTIKNIISLDFQHLGSNYSIFYALNPSDDEDSYVPFVFFEHIKKDESGTSNFIKKNVQDIVSSLLKDKES